LPEDAVEVRIELDNNVVYAYEKVSGQFLAQAQSLHLAMIEATKRYPSKKFWHPELKEDSQTTC
jgi:HEAT repeat protein